MDPFDTILTIFALVVAYIILGALYQNWRDSRQAKRLNAEWEAHKAEEAAARRAEARKLDKPMEWPAPDDFDDYLNHNKLVVRHEPSLTQGE